MELINVFKNKAFSGETDSYFLIAGLLKKKMAFLDQKINELYPGFFVIAHAAV